MRRQKLSGSVQRRRRFVEDRVVGLEDVGHHPRGDVERDLDVGGGGLSRQAEGVVEEDLVCSGLDDQRRQRLRREQLPEQPPLFVDIAADGEGRLSQNRIEGLSLLCAQ